MPDETCSLDVTSVVESQAASLDARFVALPADVKWTVHRLVDAVAGMSGAEKEGVRHWLTDVSGSAEEKGLEALRDVLSTLSLLVGTVDEAASHGLPIVTALAILKDAGEFGHDEEEHDDE